jgi:hypothetical protein
MDEYHPIPGDHTIVHHPTINLPSMGIVINTHFRCIICINCQRAVNAINVISHIRHDLPLVEVPDDLACILQNTYQLVPYDSIIYNSSPVNPVFGIPLEPSVLYFCECGKGYNAYDTLRIHQNRVAERSCPLAGKGPSFHKGYGQRLTANRSFFEIDPTPWRIDLDQFSSFPLTFCQSLPPLRDYSTMEIKGAEDEMNTSSFFHTQRWLSHLEGYSPDDISEVTKALTPEAAFGDRLRQVSETFLLSANSEIKNHNSFGILKLMGQTTECVPFIFVNFSLINIVFCFRRETTHRFDPVSEKTVKKYALTLHRLVYGVLRQLDTQYSHNYRYPPLHATQLVSLCALRHGLDRDISMADLVLLFRAACYSLFAHHQHKYDTSRSLNQFFSPVICFLVLSSVRPKGGFHLPSVITQCIAHIMYAIRSVIFFEIIKKAREDNIGISE